MSFDFFVGSMQYTVETSAIRKNGEVVYEGDLYFYRLLLGMPGLILIHEYEDNSIPKLLKTGPITSILPMNEYVQGRGNSERKTYLLSWRDQEVNTSSQFRCYAYSEEHAVHLFRLYNPQSMIMELSIKLIDKSTKTSVNIG